MPRCSRVEIPTRETPAGMLVLPPGADTPVLLSGAVLRAWELLGAGGPAGLTPGALGAPVETTVAALAHHGLVDVP